MVIESLLPWLIGMAGIFGLLIGSFLNVVVWRVPRGESLIPNSHCPRCDAPIRPWQNVPVLSWVLLRGRCAHCGESIGARYPLVEFGTGVAFALVTWWIGVWGPVGTTSSASIGLPPLAWWFALAGYLWFAGAGIALTLIDLEHQRLPDSIVLPSLIVVATLLSVSAALSGEWGQLIATLGGGGALFVFYFFIVLVYPRGIGGGDVKLAPLVGVALGFAGWAQLVVGAFAGFLFGAVVGLMLIAMRRATRTSGIPFGPFMLAGGWVGIVFGQSIAEAYFSLFGLR